MDINKIPIKPRCNWITGIGSAGKNNHCNKTATHRNRFGWDYYYCEEHARYIETVDGGRYKGSNEPISAFRRLLERARKILSEIIDTEAM